MNVSIYLNYKEDRIGESKCAVIQKPSTIDYILNDVTLIASSMYECDDYVNQVNQFSKACVKNTLKRFKMLADAFKFELVKCVYDDSKLCYITENTNDINKFDIKYKYIFSPKENEAKMIVGILPDVDTDNIEVMLFGKMKGKQFTVTKINDATHIFCKYYS